MNQPRQPRRPPQVRPFPWTQLPRYSASQVELASRLYGLLGARPIDELVAALRAELEALTGLAHGMRLRGLRVHGRGMRDVLAGDAYVTRFQLPPEAELGALIVDRALVEAWLSAMLGPDDAPHGGRPAALSHQDFGLMTYVVLRALEASGLGPLVVGSEPPDMRDVSLRLAQASSVVDIVFHLNCPAGAGLVRLLIPGELLSELELEAAVGRPSCASALAERGLGEVELEFGVCLGVLPITAREIGSLGHGDVVLPTEHGLMLETLKGSDQGAGLVIDAARGHYLPGQLTVEDARWAFHVTDLQPLPPRSPEDDVSTTQDDDEEATEYLANQARMMLEVHVGTVAVNLQQVASMQRGQVLTLNRSVGEAVDLVLHGRRVGRGELVDVEGRLGVRLTEIGSG